MSSTRYVHIRRYDFTSIRRDRKRCSVFGLSDRLCVRMSVQPLIFRPACRRLVFFYKKIVIVTACGIRK